MRRKMFYNKEITIKILMPMPENDTNANAWAPASWFGS
jgi:hypothetical protein